MLLEYVDVFVTAKPVTPDVARFTTAGPGLDPVCCMYVKMSEGGVGDADIVRVADSVAAAVREADAVHVATGTPDVNMAVNPAQAPHTTVPATTVTRRGLPSCLTSA